MTGLRVFVCSFSVLAADFVNVGAMNFIQKLRLRMRGVRTPAVSYKGKIFLVFRAGRI